MPFTYLVPMFEDDLICHLTFSDSDEIAVNLKGTLKLYIKSDWMIVFITCQHSQCNIECEINKLSNPWATPFSRNIMDLMHISKWAHIFSRIHKWRVIFIPKCQRINPSLPMPIPHCPHLIQQNLESKCRSHYLDITKH